MKNAGDGIQTHICLLFPGSVAPWRLSLPFWEGDDHVVWVSSCVCAAWGCGWGHTAPTHPPAGGWRNGGTHGWTHTMDGPLYPTSPKTLCSLKLQIMNGPAPYSQHLSSAWQVWTLCPGKDFSPCCCQQCTRCQCSVLIALLPSFIAFLPPIALFIS